MSVHGPDDLAQSLSELARTLQRQEGSVATLEQIVLAAVELVPGVDEASISVVTDRRHVDSHAPSGELPREVDALQMATGQGPCLDAVYEQQTVRVPDMQSEQRWPQFAAAASAAGARSMLSFQLYVEGSNLGALNLYGRRPNAFDEESESVGLLFASHAAVALAGAEAAENLQLALSTRDVIGQAKGILMERYKLTPDQAFGLLVRASQSTHVKLRDVADELIHSGEFTLRFE